MLRKYVFGLARARVLTDVGPHTYKVDKDHNEGHLLRLSTFLRVSHCSDIDLFYKAVWDCRVHFHVQTYTKESTGNVSDFRRLREIPPIQLHTFIRASIIDVHFNSHSYLQVATPDSLIVQFCGSIHRSISQIVELFLFQFA